jgi:hypothetical protein
MLAEDIKHTFNTWSLLYTIICINFSKKNTGCSTHASFCLFAFLQNVLNADMRSARLFDRMVFPLVQPE